MVDLSNYDFIHMTDKTVKLYGSFMNSYVDKCLESKTMISLTQKIYRILDDK